MHTKRYAKRTIQSYVYWIKGFINFNKSSTEAALSTVLTTTEIASLLNNISASHALPCKLMYGSG